MSNQLLLWPQPRQITFSDGALTLSDGQLIVLDSPVPCQLYFTAAGLQRALQSHAGVSWQIVAGHAVPPERIGLTLSVAPEATSHPQGYRLTVHSRGISIVASTPSGVFYGAQTLNQILQQSTSGLPLLQISDWPDFPHRGVMLDVSRDKVPTMQTLFNLVELLASWKINQFQLYTEHTFAYQNHPEIWAQASPLTGEEILLLDAYCRERFVELVPNQNTFGHMQRWLSHDRYKHLAECPTGFYWEEWGGYFNYPFSLYPGDPGSLELVRSLLDELLPHFSSRQFNIGGDETVDLGQGQSREIVAQRGKGRVYLDFLLKIYREVKARGHTMQFWGDVIVAHPELVPELPRDVIALEWGYEAGHPFDEHGAMFAASGIPFYVCPGTSSWRTIAGRTDNALKNLHNAALNGLKHGAVGYLIADWGDNGHWQPLPVSYPGFACGAALAWSYDANYQQDVARAVSLYAFGDPSGMMGRLAYDLGNTYLEPELQIPNSSVLFHILQESPETTAAREGLTEEGLRKTLAYLNRLLQELPNISLQHPEADLIRREFTWAARMLTHACQRGLWALAKGRKHENRELRQELARADGELLDEHRAIWLARNRIGGLGDSQAWFNRIDRNGSGNDC